MANYVKKKYFNISDIQEKNTEKQEMFVKHVCPLVLKHM